MKLCHNKFDEHFRRACGNIQSSIGALELANTFARQLSCNFRPISFDQDMRVEGTLASQLPLLFNKRFGGNLFIPFAKWTV